MKPQEPPRPDSDAVKRALLPARIAHWRKCGAHVLADKLQAELDALTEDELTTAHGGWVKVRERTARAHATMEDIAPRIGAVAKPEGRSA